MTRRRGADDPDGEPNCNSVYRVGNRLYVSCELLDPSFTPRGPGKVYVIDANAGVLRPENHDIGRFGAGDVEYRIAHGRTEGIQHVLR